MNKIEKQIVDFIKQGHSQNEVARLAGVPRSTVQKVSDQQLGVSAESIKSLTSEQISQIQVLSKKGTSNAALAEKFDTSAKTVARALLVRISDHDNGVTVIAPTAGLTKEGEFDASYDLQPGGFAKLKGKDDNEDQIVFVGAHLEDRNAYLLLGFDSNQYTVLIRKHADLIVVEEDQVGGFPTDMSLASEIVEAIVNTGSSDGQHFRLSVLVRQEESPYLLKGKLNAKNQIGYLDPVTNMTVRVGASQVKITGKALPQAAPIDKTEGTKSSLKDVKLDDAFLGKHQILILPEQVVITKDGKPLTITTDHAFYESIVQALKDKDIEKAYALMEPRKAIDRYTQGRLVIADGTVTWEGHNVSGTSIAKRVLALALRGDFDRVDRLGKFMDKVFQNPSAALVQSNRIFEFMVYSDIEIDEDGDILVYKSVRGNYMDKHSGTISNKPGTIVRMARSFVNDNNTELCSYGLHVCSLTYLRRCFGSNGQRVVRCKLNPKDIVSITKDYGNSKIRCCEYLVLDDYTTDYNRQYKTIDMEGVYKD